jgi:hypothetical protein
VHHGQDATPAEHVDLGGAYAGGDKGTVLGTAGQIVLLPGPVSEHRRHEAIEGRNLVRVDVGRLEPAQIVAAVAEQAARGRVGLDHDPGVDLKQQGGIGDPLEQLGETVLLGPLAPRTMVGGIHRPRPHLAPVIPSA